MGKNLGNSLKRFLSNKNTVTFLGVIVGIVVLFFGYQYQINSAIQPVTIPIAKVEIKAKEKITEDKLTTVQLSKQEVNKLEGLIQNKGQLLNKFVNHDTVIPKNGFFYSSNVVEEKTQPNYISENMCYDCRLFTLEVNSVSDYDITYGNSIMPGVFTDIYVKAQLDSENKIYFSKLIDHAEVLAVRDSEGNDVFSGGNNNRPDKYIFAFTKDYWELLNIAKISDSYGMNKIDLIIVPRNRTYSKEGKEASLASTDLEKYIRSFLKPVHTDEETTKEETTTP